MMINNSVANIFFKIDIYSYDGPLVVLTTAVCAYAGEKEASSICIFCGALFKRVTVHIRAVHAEEQRVQDIEALQTAPQREAGYLQLIREGNFNWNVKCISMDRGFVITTRKPDKYMDIKRMLHCLNCYAYIQRKHYAKHIITCPRRSESPSSSLQVSLGQLGL
jgi:hypothetical protein